MQFLTSFSFQHRNEDKIEFGSLFHSSYTSIVWIKIQNLIAMNDKNNQTEKRNIMYKPKLWLNSLHSNANESCVRIYACVFILGLFLLNLRIPSFWGQRQMRQRIEIALSIFAMLKS